MFWSCGKINKEEMIFKSIYSCPLNKTTVYVKSWIYLSTLTIGTYNNNDYGIFILQK